MALIHFYQFTIINIFPVVFLKGHWSLVTSHRLYIAVRNTRFSHRTDYPWSCNALLGHVTKGGEWKVEGGRWRVEGGRTKLETD